MKRAGLHEALAALALVGGLSISASAAPAREIEHLGVDLNGQEVRLSEQRGKVVIVSFWASWCASCLRELPALEGLQQAIGENHLAVFAVNHGEDQQRWERIRTVFGSAKIRLLRDPGERAASGLGVEEIPTLFVFDSEGRLAHEHLGYGDDETLDPLIAEVQQLLR